MRTFILILCSCLSFIAVAQQPDSVIVNAPPTAPQAETQPPKVVSNDTIGPRKHSPKTATILSLVLPGAGQVYNKKNWWWKVPIIYGGGSALVYGVVFYQRNYADFRDAYAYRISHDGAKQGIPRFDRYGNDNLLSIRNSYRDTRDQCIIGLALLYTLQVIDASVEAHFFDFNVSEDLSLNVQPQFVMNGAMNYTGVQLTLNLK